MSAAETSRPVLVQFACEFMSSRSASMGALVFSHPGQIPNRTATAAIYIPVYSCFSIPSRVISLATEKSALNSVSKRRVLTAISSHDSKERGID
jgi:hypothetical protein